MADDEVLFSNAGGGHDIRVTALLNADEFIFLRDEAKARGISASSYLRQMVNRDRRRVALEALSLANPAPDTTENAQNLHNIVQMLAKAMKG